ncbi:hypothetical protein BGX26_008439 [Mortierella sp. AD094]|nr:hypothetical protein BGX26_008439 [Mortierella sp. AD094]
MKFYIPILLGLTASQCRSQQVILNPQRGLGCHHSIYNDDPRTPDGLIQELIRAHGPKITNATGMKAYVMDKTSGRGWRVSGMNNCNVEIGPISPIGDSLSCPLESPSPCQLDVTFIDTQTFTTSVGFYAEYSISASGGTPGVFEVKTSLTVGTSYSYDKQYSHGRELKYSFPVSPGRTCTPSHASYRQSCTGNIWEVNSDRSGWWCTDLTDLKFDDKHAFFSYPGDDKWFHYVRIGPYNTVLYTMHTRDGFPPKSCSDLDGGIEVRTMRLLDMDVQTKASLEYDNGNSISATTCIYN